MEVKNLQLKEKGCRMRSRNVETDPIKGAVNYARVGVRNEGQRPDYRLQGDVTATACDYGRLQLFFDP